MNEERRERMERVLEQSLRRVEAPQGLWERLHRPAVESLAAPRTSLWWAPVAAGMALAAVLVHGSLAETAIPRQAGTTPAGWAQTSWNKAKLGTTLHLACQLCHAGGEKMVN